MRSLGKWKSQVSSEAVSRILSLGLRKAQVAAPSSHKRASGLNSETLSEVGNETRGERACSMYAECASEGKEEASQKDSSKN